MRTRHLPLAGACLPVLTLILVACGGGGSGGDDDDGKANLGTPASDGGIYETYEVDLATASYINGGALPASAASASRAVTENRTVGCDVASDGDLLIAANLTAAPGVTLHSIEAGEGYVLRYSSDGQTLEQASVVGTEIKDIEVAHTSGAIAVTGLSGTFLLNAAGSAKTWSVGQAGTRVSVGPGDDTVAITSGSTLYVYQGSDGSELVSTSVSGVTAVEDVAVDSANELAIVTGYTQVAGDLQQPFIRAYSYASGSEGDLEWTNYDWTNTEASDEGLRADSNGRHVVIGRDGSLYFIGSTDGGTTTFQRKPASITESVSLHQPDHFQHPMALSASARLLFLAEYTPSTGAFVSGTWLMARLSGGGQNTTQGLAIDADASGNVVVGGHCRFAVENRDRVTVSGLSPTPAGPYVCIFDANWDIEAWVTMSLSDTGDIVGVAWSGSEVLMVGDEMPDDAILTDPIDDTASPAWFGILPTTAIPGGAG